MKRNFLCACTHYFWSFKIRFSVDKKMIKNF